MTMDAMLLIISIILFYYNIVDLYYYVTFSVSIHNLPHSDRDLLCANEFGPERQLLWMTHLYLNGQEKQSNLKNVFADVSRVEPPIIFYCALDANRQLLFTCFFFVFCCCFFFTQTSFADLIFLTNFGSDLGILKAFVSLHYDQNIAMLSS